jgi:hypothetical protein
MQLQDLLIGLSIIFVGPIVLGIIFYFIDELFKVFPEIERKFLIRLKCDAGQSPGPRKSAQLLKTVNGAGKENQRRNNMKLRDLENNSFFVVVINDKGSVPLMYKDDNGNLFQLHDNIVLWNDDRFVNIPPETEIQMVHPSCLVRTMLLEVIRFAKDYKREVRKHK